MTKQQKQHQDALLLPVVTETPPLSSSLSPSPSRLPHLDGLRALALFAVLFFHFKIPLFSGGFIGVDIFFTLSGFLITRNILHALTCQTFSLFSFYLRRFFRLYPASAFTIISTLLFTTIIVTPIPSILVFNSAIAALTFWSNVFFHRQGSYFDTTFEMRPFLHFWSLSVEEQFYFIWPPLLMALWYTTKINNRIVVIKFTLIILSIISFLLAVGLHSEYLNWTFYELPCRVYQFAIGAYLAVQFLNQNDQCNDETISITDQKSEHNTIIVENSQTCLSDTSASVNDQHYNSTVTTSSSSSSSTDDDDGSKDISDLHDGLSIIAILTIVLSFSLLPENASPFRVLPTTLSTAILIAYPRSVVCQVCFQSLRIQNIGRISYSVYLVHWPIAILGKYFLQALRFPSFTYIFFLLPLSFILGYKLFVHIETTLRTPVSLKHYTGIFLLTTLSLSFAIYGSVSKGMQWRFPEEGKTGYRTGSDVYYKEYWRLQHDVSHLYVGGSHPNIYVKRVGAFYTGTMSKYVFFGDSFTEHLSAALHNVGIRHNVFFEMHYAFHCGLRPSTLLSTWTGAKAGYVCKDTHMILWSHIDALPNDTTIVIANWWCAPVRFETILKDIFVEMTNVHGKQMAIFAEPPGLHEKYMYYYPCADMRVLFIGRFISWITGKQLEGGKNCLDFKHGLKGEWQSAAQRPVYKKVFQTFLKNVPFFDLSKHMCVQHTQQQQQQDKLTCQVPANLSGTVHEIGYKHDLAHLSFEGSDYVTDFVDLELFGKEAKVENPALAIT